MPKRAKSKKTNKDQNHLNIDPTKQPNAREVMYIAGALATIGMDKGISLKYREVARVSSVWLSRVAVTLYENETKAIEATEENNHQPGATETGQG